MIRKAIDCDVSTHDSGLKSSDGSFFLILDEDGRLLASTGDVEQYVTYLPNATDLRRLAAAGEGFTWESASMRVSFRAMLLTKATGTVPAHSADATWRRLLTRKVDAAQSSPTFIVQVRVSGIAPQQQAKELSPRQHEVLALLVEGFDNKEIAHRLHLSPHTVHVHVRTIFKKLNVTSRKALRAGADQARRRMRVQP